MPVLKAAASWITSVCLLQCANFAGEAAGTVSLRARRLEKDQPIRIGKRHRLKKHRVDDRKDRRVDADAERKRGHRRDGETRRMPELAKRVTNVGDQVVHVLALDVSKRKMSSRIRTIRLKPDPSEPAGSGRDADP